MLKMLLLLIEIIYFSWFWPVAMSSINQGLCVSKNISYFTVSRLLFSYNKIFGCPTSIVEFRTEELMKKAVEKVNKHNFNGRPLKVKEVGHMEQNY